MTLRLVRPRKRPRSPVAWAREILRQAEADGTIVRRPAPPWMIEEDRTLRRIVRRSLRESGRSRSSPALVRSYLEQVASFGVTDAADIYDTPIPVELAASRVREHVTADGLLFARDSVRDAAVWA